MKQNKCLFLCCISPIVFFNSYCSLHFLWSIKAKVNKRDFHVIMVHEFKLIYCAIIATPILKCA